MKNKICSWEKSSNMTGSMSEVRSLGLKQITFTMHTFDGSPNMKTWILIPINEIRLNLLMKVRLKLNYWGKIGNSDLTEENLASKWDQMKMFGFVYKQNKWYDLRLTHVSVLMKCNQVKMTMINDRILFKWKLNV